MIPNFSLASAPAYSQSEESPEAGTNTFAAPANYNPDQVSRSAGFPSVQSAVYSDGTTGTVVGPSRVSEVGNSFGLSGPGRSDAVALKRYTVLKEHAKGGMGQVSIAVDEELDREVALKEIQPRYAFDRSVAARFLLEARVTGRLEHPGIVPVYGLNRHPDGRPYYAMRFISGESLQDAVQAFHKADTPDRDPHARALALRQLLTRFVDVCNTIAYSHSRGILHRDLKPANVMLGGFGETLVVDWGLAKDTTVSPKKVVTTDSTQIIPALASERPVMPLPPPPVVEGPAPSEADIVTKTQVQVRPAMSLAGPPAEDSGELTEVGKAMGTPAFMAPEQADGRWDDVGMLADIYSLGATLYAILSGKAPFRGDTQDILNKVRRGEPTPIHEHKPNVPPALTAICHKAMALRPQDRYATALDLAGDVDRWMADEPVSVYREPWTARVTRWARRHRNLVFGSLAVLLTALVAITVGYFQVNAEQKRTEAEKKKTDEANLALIDEKDKVQKARTFAEASREDARDALLTLTDDAIGEILTSQHAVTGNQQQFLVSVIKLYQRFIQQAPDTQNSLFLAGAHFRVGRLQVKLGEHKEARNSYEKVFELAKGQISPEWTLLRGETELYSGIQYLSKGQYPSAQKQLEEAEKTFLGLIPPGDGPPTKLEYWHRLGQAQDRLGMAFYGQGQLDNANIYFRASLTNREVLAKAAQDVPEYQSRIAQSYRLIAMVSNAQGNRAEALENANKARLICSRLLKNDPTSAVYLVLLADVDGILSIATAPDGTVDGRPTPPLAKPSTGKVRSTTPLASQQTESARFAESAVKIWSQLVQLYPADVGYRQQLATANLNLSIAEQRAGRGKVAADALRTTYSVLDALEEIVPDNPSTAKIRGRAFHAEAVQQRDEGEFPKARTAAEKAIATSQALVDKSPNNPRYRNDLACYQIELAAIDLQLPSPDRKPTQAILNKAWGNVIEAVRSGVLDTDADFWANVRSFGRVHVDLLADINRLDTVREIANQVTELKLRPDAERYEAAGIYGRAALQAIRDEKVNDPNNVARAKAHAEQALAKLAELEMGFEWLRAIRTDPDLAVVRELPDFEDTIREFREPAPLPRGR
ncbi:serine/threonine-protein kinase [Limnoglobus roseus]|uniref:serine/threonine-protein kinase n=1 Tax=Limnoglobus roseus TaxID=2598579 RepID=UPI001C49BA4B|nr:serine/threonine-protein kinase [Limnoglobus roseus]